jgi:hypothetical protein
MPSMRFQFSILTMLVRTVALAVATALCVSAPVHWQGCVTIDNMNNDVYLVPSAREISWRLASAGPLAVLVSLCLLWASRRIVNFMRGRI